MTARTDTLLQELEHEAQWDRASRGSVGDFFKDVFRAGVHPTGPEAERLRAAASGVNTDIDSEGGFLVPSEHASGLWARAYGQGELLRRCTQWPEPAGNTFAIPTIKESSREDGSRFGGGRWYWVDEGAALPETFPRFALEEHRLRKGAVYVPVSNELLEDVPQLGEFVLRLASLEAAYAVESEIVRGTGAGRPLGLLNAGCKITVSKVANQQAATVQGKNIVDMLGRLWPACWKNAVWLFNPALLPQLSTLAIDTAYGSGSSVAVEGRLWNWNGSATSGGYPTLAGRPAIPCEYCSTVGAEGDLILVDLSQYSVISKRRFVLSTHVEFLADRSAFKFTLRIDGAPLWETALTPDNGTDTMSPIITLQTRE